MALSIQEILKLKKTPLSVVQRHVLDCLLILKGVGLGLIITLILRGWLNESTWYFNTLIFILAFIFAMMILHLRSTQIKKVHLALKEKIKQQKSKDLKKT